MRTATEHKLQNRTKRDKLIIRKKPYYVSLSPGLCLGYLARGGKNARRAGAWISRRQVGERVVTNTGSHSQYKTKQLGQADDLPGMLADGLTILDYDQACAKAREHAANLARGPVRKALTVRAAIDFYLASVKQREGRVSAQTESKFNKWVLKHPIADVPVNSLTLRQLQEWRDGMTLRDEDDPDRERRSRDTANRTMAALKAALNHAFDDAKETGVMNRDAWGRSLKAYKKVNGERTYRFSVEDVHRLIQAAEQGPEPIFADVIRGLFFLGARPGDVRELCVRDFKPKDMQMDLPRATKTKARTTTLTAEGVEFFSTLSKGKLPNAWLLVQSDGTPWTAEQQKVAFRTSLFASKLVTKEAWAAMNPRDRPCLYGLRHAYVSHAIHAGVPILVIAKNVGTSVQMIEKFYYKELAKEHQAWIEKGAPSLRHATA
jgi:integrase